MRGRDQRTKATASAKGPKRDPSLANYPNMITGKESRRNVRRVSALLGFGVHEYC